MVKVLTERPLSVKTVGEVFKLLPGAQTPTAATNLPAHDRADQHEQPPIAVQRKETRADVRHRRGRSRHRRYVHPGDRPDPHRATPRHRPRRRRQPHQSRRRTGRRRTARPRSARRSPTSTRRGSAPAPSAWPEPADCSPTRPGGPPSTRPGTDAGLRCPYAVHGDALVAYASGTAAPDGTVLIAGTGAITAQVHELRLDRIADGHGWLLGDAGSGFWLGREAVRRLLADLDAGRAPGALATTVLTELLGSAEIAARPRDTVDAVVQAVTRRAPDRAGPARAAGRRRRHRRRAGRHRADHRGRRGTWPTSVGRIRPAGRGDTDRARRRPAHRGHPARRRGPGRDRAGTGRTRRCAPPGTAPPPQPGSPPAACPR